MEDANLTKSDTDSDTDRIDIVLNEALRIITGAVQSTPIEWLSVLANIEPPSIRRTKAFLKEWEKQQIAENLPIHTDLCNLPDRRLVSRHPPWLTYSNINLPFRPGEEWKSIWENGNVRHNELIGDPNAKLPGFDIPRKAWVRLNRIRTGHGNCAHFLFLWNLVESPECDCGAPDQTMAHIANDCPIRKFESGVEGLNRLNDGAIKWLMELDLSI